MGEAQSVHSETVPAIREAWKIYVNEVARLDGDRNVSVDGRRAGEAQAAEKRDAAIQTSEALVSERTDAILRAFPKSVLPPPSQELASVGQLAFARFPHATAQSFFGEGLGWLERASDPNTPPSKQLEANQLIQEVFLPCCQRRADAPERHARTLQPAYEKLAALMEIHIDSVLGHARHRLAVGVVAQARNDFKWLVSQARTNGGWDELVLSTGVTAFDFS